MQENTSAAVEVDGDHVRESPRAAGDEELDEALASNLAITFRRVLNTESAEQVAFIVVPGMIKSMLASSVHADANGSIYVPADANGSIDEMPPPPTP